MRQGWWRHTAVILTIVVLFMAGAALTDWPWWEYAFRSDMSPVSWLSSALLLANAAVALTLTLGAALPRALGAALSAALAALALDEQFQLHEQLQESFAAGRFGRAPTVAVGIGGVIAAVMLLRAVKPSAARALIAGGVAVGVFAIWVDLGSPPEAVAALEEAFEVIAESLFLCGLLELSRPHVHSSS
jgi:hypothetical protein